MKLVCHEPVNIPDGVYKATIKAVKLRTEPFEYVDVFVVPDGFEDKLEQGLKYGCPNYLSPNSKLGKLLSLFVELRGREVYDPEELLVGKRVSIIVSNEPAKDGSGVYARVLEVKPLKEGD